MCVYVCPVWTKKKKKKRVCPLHTDMMLIYHWQVLPEAFIEVVMARLGVVQ